MPRLSSICRGKKRRMDQPALCKWLCGPMVAIYCIILYYSLLLTFIDYIWHYIYDYITMVPDGFDGSTSNGKEACLHTRSLWGQSGCVHATVLFDTRRAMQIIWMKPSETIPKHRRSSRHKRLPFESMGFCCYSFSSLIYHDLSWLRILRLSLEYLEYLWIS